MTIILRDQVLDFGTGALTYDVDDVLGPVNQRRTNKPGSPEDNRSQQKSKLTQARDAFRTNYQQWGTLTAQQKDTANRQAQRAIGNLIAYVMEDMNDGGD